MDNQTTNNNLKKLTKRSDAENPNLKKMVESGMSRDNTIMPSGLIFDGLSYNAIRNKRIQTKSRPLDIKGGAIDWGKSYQGNIDLLGRASDEEEPTTTPLLLDDYPATAAYSLRKLRTDYSGAAIEVRIDTTGQPEYDIGFDSNGELDTADLLSKAGANDAYVTTWYDQSGAGIDIENITASKQPKLVNNGILETKGGLPVVKFNGGQVLNATIQGDFIDVSGRASFAVAYGDNIDSTFVRFSEDFDASGGDGDGLSFGLGITTNDVGVRNYQVSPLINESQTLPYTLSDVVLMSHITTGSTGLTYIDSQSAIGNAVLRGGSGYWGVGARTTSLIGALNGGIFEAIHFASDQSANRGAIERNINDYYNIYPEPSTLLDDLSNVILAPSLNKIRTAYSGNAINVRESGSNTEQQIGFLPDNELDESALTTFTGANDGLVDSFYDESGNGYDFVQTTAARQPEIVNNGVVNKIGGKPTLSFGSGGMATSSVVDLGGASEVWLFFVLNIHNTTSFQVLYETSPDLRFNEDSFALIINSSGELEIDQKSAPTRNTNKFAISTGYQLLTVQFIGGQTGTNAANAWINSASQTLTNTRAASSPASYANYNHFLGARNNATLPFLGDISKPILLTGDQSANRGAIETNINNYYNIYPETYNFEQALEFDGVDDFADLPLIESQNFSMSFWINVNALTTQVILGESSGGRFFALDSQSSTNRIRLINATSNVNYTYTTPLNIGDWNHVFFSYNSGASNLYLNGVATAKDGNNTGDFSWLFLGKRSTGSPFFNGKLDDLVVWDGVTGTAQNAIDLYNGGAGVDPTTVIANPNRWYKFNNNPNDSGSDGQNLTLNNFSANPYVQH